MNCLLSAFFFFNFPKTTYLVWLWLFDCKESCVFQSTQQLPNFSQPFFSITHRLWRIGSWHTCLTVKTWLYSTNLLNQTILVHLTFVARNTLKDFLIQEEVAGNTCCENSSWESRISISVRSLELQGTKHSSREILSSNSLQTGKEKQDILTGRKPTDLGLNWLRGHTKVKSGFAGSRSPLSAAVCYIFCSNHIHNVWAE